MTEPNDVTVQREINDATPPSVAIAVKDADGHFCGIRCCCGQHVLRVAHLIAVLAEVVRDDLTKQLERPPAAEWVSAYSNQMCRND